MGFPLLRPNVPHTGPSVCFKVAQATTPHLFTSTIRHCYSVLITAATALVDVSALLGWRVYAGRQFAGGGAYGPSYLCHFGAHRNRIRLHRVNHGLNTGHGGHERVILNKASSSVNKISISMATYNGALYLQQQLESLINQVLLPDELVITDDGSSDDSMALIKEFARHAPFPVEIVINESRLGYRANFMKNAALCKHDLIAFCDQDDIWHPDKLSQIANTFSNTDVLLSYHNARLIDKSGLVTGRANIAKVRPLNSPSSIHPYTWGLGFLLVFHRSLMQFADLWPESIDTIELHNPMAHDMWIYFLASVFGSIAYIDLDLVDYRQHGQNTVGFQWKTQSPWKNLQSKAALGAGEYNRLAKVSWSRHQILEHAIARLDGIWLQRAETSSALYRRYAEIFEARSKIYSDQNITVRLESLWNLLRRGAYGRNNTWGFSYGSLVKDSLMAGSYNVVSGLK